MNIKELKIKGYRGFRTSQTLSLSQPNSQTGSGLTVMVGPNNSGKSTIIEALSAVSSAYRHTPSFSIGKRNVMAGDFIKIEVITNCYNPKTLTLESVMKGSSESIYHDPQSVKPFLKVFTLPSRRNFEPFFGKHEMDRENFLASSISLQPKRSGLYDLFNARLFNIQKNDKKFNETLRYILGNDFEWAIDTTDEGNHFIKIIKGDVSHSSDGAGEGIVSLFTIIDALHDSKPNDIIAIDEPELSLHPSLQKKLNKVLSDFAKDRQIIISTHSPYFINWSNLYNGGTLARVIDTTSNGTEIHNLNPSSVYGLKKLAGNLFNPHTLGTTAVEVFFLNDNIILTEGQEDVIYFQRISEIIEINHNSDFFGFGAGGAGNMKTILNLLRDLGFKKVSTILDNDKQKEKDDLKIEFPNYSFHCIPTHDIRDKEAVKAREKIIGLIDRKGENIKPEFEPSIKDIFQLIKTYNER